MDIVKLKEIKFGGLTLQMPVVWNVITESYTELDGRECSMIDISAEEGGPRSIVTSYSPMTERSDRKWRKTRLTSMTSGAYWIQFRDSDIG